MSILSSLKQALGILPSHPTDRVPAQAMDHPLLGPLVPDETHTDTLVGRAAHHQGFVQIQVSPDDKSMDAALTLMAEEVSLLDALDEKCRRAIARDSLESYNTDWRFGQRVLPDGRLEDFEKPFPSEDEFCAKLQF